MQLRNPISVLKSLHTALPRRYSSRLLDKTKVVCQVTVPTTNGDRVYYRHRVGADTVLWVPDRSLFKGMAWKVLSGVLHSMAFFSWRLKGRGGLLSILSSAECLFCLFSLSREPRNPRKLSLRSKRRPGQRADSSYAVGRSGLKLPSFCSIKKSIGPAKSCPDRRRFPDTGSVLSVIFTSNCVNARLHRSALPIRVHPDSSRNHSTPSAP